ncbi:efflux RND transporter periplasmic adaptor subunit [Dyadobacter tibetensis]|uniref:efflux RND transporter periplasmic adaptor subunit n=1 Tax=Dyadobacter tibetensis TaxID=1211851 RepID=UPI00046EB44D|nr:efflux RND transporter periplasmic adaptor subunit [Dyadobacter tibetensis]
MKKIIWPTLMLALTAFLSACSTQSETVSDNKDTVLTIPVARLFPQQTELHREYVGSIHALKNVEIYARVKGYLEEVYVDEGKPVKKGQVLFRINNEEYSAELAKAKANQQSAMAQAKAAELEVKRVKLLVDKDIISKTELEVAQANYSAVKAKIEEANSAVTNASIQLAHTRIRAPFNGVINRIPLKIGSLINEGTLLTSISDNTNVNVYFNVSENEYLEYVKARRETEQNENLIDLELADGTYFPEKGKIETMEGQFDESTGSIAFRARFANPQGILKHGSTGTVRLTNMVDEVLLVPQKAVFDIQDKSFVYLVGEDNTVKSKIFEPKLRIGDYYIVKSGLETGDRIVYEGIQVLKDGMTIKPKLISLQGKQVKKKDSKTITSL